ncbi:phosphotriesterase-related protein [Vagococcus sp. BWB3-3]|uniref:Phosphotriesterase-related protein n=1 Tax=Vagococcus allomyrinae TaxID=2794353 RepID=A0A940PBG3_9ENTE|nr:phosphotriesterase-related protein [Vagococcus allomyrinae]MBP1040953.1 phosphotriesterase-related protein [Vagococcus allomyrinae]
MSKKIRTVLGDISMEELGFTYSHEHLWCCPPPQQTDRDFELTNYEASLAELKTFKAIGGQTLVDASTLDYGRDGSKLKAMSQESGVHVLGVSGFNKHIYFDQWVETESIEQITQRLVKDVEIGMDGSDAKAGILKAGSWYNLIHPLEEKITRAVARAHKLTGAPIWLHTEAGTMGLEMLDILEGEGVDLSVVAVGHSDRNADPYYHLQIVKRGAYIQYDGPGKVKYYPDDVRIELIKNILAHGYGHRLLISGDMGRQSYLHAYGGGPGFSYIKQLFIPRMLDEGISQAAIDQIFYTNPAVWLAKF